MWSVCVVGRLHQGQYNKAETHLLQATTSLERWYGKSHPRVADALNDMAGLLCNPRNKDGSVGVTELHASLCADSLVLLDQY